MTAFEPSAEHAAIREGVAQVCAGFPGAYWRDLDARRAYPDAFVKALTEAGYLSAMIPEAYGGSGLNLSAAAAILEEIHKNGCNAAACHAQMYTMGTVLGTGAPSRSKSICPASPTARCACRRSASPSRRAAPTRWRCARPRRATATTMSSTARRSGPRARNIPTSCSCSRARRRATRSRSAPMGSASSSIDLRALVGNGVTIKPIRTMMNHATTEVFFDRRGSPRPR